MFWTFVLVSGVRAHSWADNVGGGSYRGAQGADDLIKQRYFCPLASLAECQPPASTSVVLTSSNMRPCRKDFETPQWGSAVPGKPMYMHWAGNGHTGDKSTGSCVSVYIAPYSIDPDMSSFQQLASCLPYSHGADVTDATINIPANLPVGQYTVFWLWDFSPFWFSSCSDIYLKIDIPSPTPFVPMTHAMPSLLSSEKIRYQSAGCSGLRTGFCLDAFGPTSYCKSWSLDRCKRASCHIDDLSSKPCQSQTTKMPSITTTTIKLSTLTVLTTNSPSTIATRPSSTTLTPTNASALLTAYTKSGCSKFPQTACATLFGPSSYCKSWASDGCSRSVCFGPVSTTKLGPC